MRLLTFSVLKSCKLKQLCHPLARKLSFDPQLKPIAVAAKCIGDANLLDVAGSWPEDVQREMRAAVQRDMQVLPNFISEQEEASLLAELEPVLKRMRYEFDHWDNAIHGFRETERSSWSPENEAVVARVRALAFADGAGGEPLPYAHVLDLAPAGQIKPHVDAIRFCGEVIAGLCLSSPAVMRLRHGKDARLALAALLPRRCLYLMRGSARYDFSHAVLGNEESFFRGERVRKLRRVAVIYRSQPLPEDAPASPSNRLT